MSTFIVFIVYLVPLTIRNFQVSLRKQFCNAIIIYETVVENMVVITPGKQKCQSFVRSISFYLYIQTHPV